MLLSARRILIAAVLACAGAFVHANGPTFWVVGTVGELLKGTSDGVLIDRNGSISAGPQLTNLLTSAPAQIWTLAAETDGTLWAGTGGDGRVIRVRPGQREETLLDAEENNVFAIAVAPTRVYAATGPDGKIYAIEGTAPARVFFDPPEKYIWALAVDATGRLWVGAGTPAVIYRVEPDGTSLAVYRPPAAHVVSLGRDASGRMLAGTDSPGRLYRFDAADRPFVMLDAGPSEIRAIANGPNGAVYAAALNRSGEDAGAGGEAISIAAAMGPASQPPNAPPAPPSGPAGNRSTIYKLDATGSWESFWESTDSVYDIAVQPNGSLLVASGPEGRLYTVQSDRQVFLYTGVDAKQITRLIGTTTGRASVMATANPGRVIALGPAAQSPAVYTSPVRDTKSASTWGAIRWEANGPVKLFTRSGNTERPDETWSEWSGPYALREGDRILSPPARFLQWKAELTPAGSGPAPQLTSVTAAYLTRNARPIVSSILVHPAGLVFQRPFSSDDTSIAGMDNAQADARRPPGADQNPAPNPPTGRRMFQKGLRTIGWKAEDGDGDRLSYSLSYRREGTAAWHDLKTGLTDPIFVWDTTTVADGRYVVRVTAADEPTNTPDRALSGDHESDPIDVDNTAPIVTTELARLPNGLRLVVRVRDAHSPIQKVEYSLGGDAWRLIYPVDGLADSPEERYEIPVSSEADAARIIIRASDVMQNAASQSVR